MHKSSCVGPSVRFSGDDDDQLIAFVSNHTILYDLKNPDFKNTLKKDLIWEEAGKILNRTGTDCKKRWKSVRDHYRREKKEGKGTGKAAKKKRAVYWDCLRFLDFPITSVHTPTEHTQMSSGLKTSSDDFKIPKSNKRKENAFINKYLKEKKEDRDHFKKCLEELTTPEPEEDATDMFFKTVAATVKKFRPDLATKTKAKIFQITTEMELLNQQSLNTGFTNIIHGDSENFYHSSAASSTCTTPYTLTPADTD